MAKKQMNKEEKVYETFQTISKDYDKLNDIISFNMHKRWKRDTIKELDVVENSKMLDVCCGTGDFSLMLSLERDKKIRVTGLDFSENMISVAREKKEKLKLDNVEFVHGNAMELPFKDNTFDHITIGFGLRNTPDYEQVIGEMMRVIRPGGKVACLDTSHPTLPIYKQLYWFYFKHIMPRIGQLFSKHRKEYQWLNDSTEKFLSKKELKDLFLKVGLTNVKVKSYAGGSSALHIGVKPE
ncbi:demethylmenaquinone methyltransferase [Anaeromicrobium sediminis]|uniref:Demethylmenaquinone methyltransferase n=1 Tax=Anaeromicrobium sediminis TaxID=1478221 RepID=A0A267MHJ3_9FIRM|nr:demethylmenaquinone methyltransferase [Anaeromicrobium sediminis]PAB58398.1 bifunctional demethylmenaquinone methyltransferase/2-methoxy-6-polyprenyl-1,4-benzoquinol methylase [Anaeromicrobium sediminis]